MSDLFGEWVPDSWIDEVFAACEKAPQHNYLFLTKNPHRYNEYGVDAYTIPGIFNLWYGMSVTTEAQFDKTWLLPEYCNTFISIEPILEDLHTRDMDARFENLDWMIVGAETGIQKEKGVPKREWIEQIMESSRKYEIPLFMKSSLAQIWGEPLIKESAMDMHLARKQRELTALLRCWLKREGGVDSWIETKCIWKCLNLQGRMFQYQL